LHARLLADAHHFLTAATPNHALPLALTAAPVPVCGGGHAPGVQCGVSARAGGRGHLRVKGIRLLEERVVQRADLRHTTCNMQLDWAHGRRRGPTSHGSIAEKIQSPHRRSALSASISSLLRKIARTQSYLCTADHFVGRSLGL
jgi:hypothetical protein